LGCAEYACAADRALSGYYLEQESKTSGILKIIVCADRVRLDGIKSGFTCISKAPQWDVFIFRQDRKHYSQMTYRAWMRLESMVLNSGRFSTIKPLAESHGEEKDQQIVNYEFRFVQDSDNMGLFRSDGKVTSTAMRARVKCMDWPVDIQPSSIVGKFYGLPPLHGIPLSIHSGSGSSYKEIEMQTKKSVKSCSISPSQFDLPAGFIRVAYTDNMFLSEQAKGAYRDFFGEVAK
jgi:hypothetical protein